MAPRNKHSRRSPPHRSPQSSSALLPEDPTAVKLDGRTLEGGGQILRLSLCLSALTRRAVHIHDIRGNRPKGGGLGRQHLTGVEWLAKASGVTLDDVEVGSKELMFKPGPGDTENIWYTRRSGPHATEVRHAEVTQSTPGSIGLVLQAVLPFIIFSNTSHVIKLSITGGTHVPFSPSFEYIQHVFLPTLREKLGLPDIQVELVKDGWTYGRLTVGELLFTIPPFNGTLSAFRIENRGEVERLEVFSRIPGAGHRALEFAINKHVNVAFPTLCAGGNITTHPLEDSKDDKRYYVLMVAHTSNGYRIGYDYLYQRKVKDVTKVIEHTVEDCTRGLLRELARGGCVDEYLQDQLVVFQTLAEGSSFVDGGGWEGSLHTRTARWVAEEMFGTLWDGKGGCKGGIGYVAGQGIVDAASTTEVAEAKAVEAEVEVVTAAVEELEVVN